MVVVHFLVASNVARYSALSNAVSLGNTLLCRFSFLYVAFSDSIEFVVYKTLILHSIAHEEKYMIQLMPNEEKNLPILDQNGYMYVDEAHLILRQGETSGTLTRKLIETIVEMI